MSCLCVSDLMGLGIPALAAQKIFDILTAAPPSSIADGEWARWHAFYRLRITGTGTVTLDARDGLGNISTGVESFAATGATDQIEYPFPGEDTVEVRATLGGTTTAALI